MAATVKQLSDAALLEFLMVTQARIERLKALKQRTLNDQIALRYSQLEAQRVERELTKRLWQAAKKG